ncbi:MAG: hypothetical protein WAW37_05285 [Syntrophobacteraceae bacterium]
MTWSFVRWRIHFGILTAIGGMVLIVGKFGWASWFDSFLQPVVTYFVIWLGILTFVVAPACLWHEQDEKLCPAIAFIEHEDNNKVYPPGYRHMRVTVENRGAVLLNDVQVKLMDVEPRPADFITLNVPLSLMHKRNESQFSLQPWAQQTVDLLWLNIRSPLIDHTSDDCANLDHVVNTVPRKLPFDRYRFKLIVSANETLPKEQWFNVEVNREGRIILEG